MAVQRIKLLGVPVDVCSKQELEEKMDRWVYLSELVEEIESK